MRKFEIVRPQFRTTQGELQLPQRADNGSAGYDFYSPITFEIAPHKSVLIKTDIKAKMKHNEVLMLFVRSSTGIKRQVAITDGVSIIDSTFYGNKENDGNISMALTNFGDTTQHFNKGDRIIQGIFIKYLKTYKDKPTHKKRVGGIGSTR